MSYTFLLDAGEESSAECFSDIPASVLWRLNLTAGAYLLSDSETEYYRISRFGTRSKHSMEDLGEDSSILYVADSPARIAVGSSTKTGINGERSGLYSQMRRVVGEIGPRYVLMENSAALLVRGLGTVLRDMAKMGYDCRWGVFSAGDVGALHERERLFILSNRDGFMGWPRAWSEQQYGQAQDEREMHTEHACDHYRAWLEMARSIVRMDDDVADQVDRTRAIGNGQVPAVVKLAWETLTQ